MKSFEHDYLLETPVSHSLVKSVRLLGEFRGRQVLFSRQSPEVLETLRRAAMIQSVESSNRIEGITVLPDRLDALVRKSIRPRDRSEQEVAGYRDVLAEIHANHDRMHLSTDLVLDWHRRMLKYTGEKGGEWKTNDNAILEVAPDGRQFVRFRPVSSLATPRTMDRLVQFYERISAEGKADPLFLMASFILDFECVHPFADGNGRIGRLLTLFLLYQNGYEVGRYISLERIVEESKETYYEALRRSSENWHEARHDLLPWWEYFLGVLAAAYGEFETRVGAVTSARGAKREMVVDAIRRLPARFKFSDLQQACPGVSYPTLKRALSDMKKDGGLRCLGKGRDAEWERTGSPSR